MYDGSEKCRLTKMLWSVSIKTRTFASVNTCNGSKHVSCLKLLKKYRTIEHMCSDAHSITLIVVICFNLQASVGLFTLDTNWLVPTEHASESHLLYIRPSKVNICSYKTTLHKSN